MKSAEEILDLERAEKLEISDGEDILNPEELERKTRNLTFEEALTFESSGTSGEPKRIPYAIENLEEQKKHEKKAFLIGGMTEEDVVMTLGAPLNSISGWASRSGSRKVGAEVLNRSFNDYKKVIKSRENRDVTCIFATPLVAKAIGNEIEEEFENPENVFPNMSKGFMFGDLLPENLKQDLKEQWGFDQLRSLYGTVEADVIAIEDKTGKLVPLIDRLVIEILPYENGEKQQQPVDIREIEDEVKGSILISDPERDKIDITRYEIGDIIRVYPEDPIPHIEVLGREDNTINLGGAPLYENELHKAIVDTYGSQVTDWKVLVSRENSKPALDLFVVGEIQEEKEKLLENLFRRAPPVEEAYSDVGSGIINHIDIQVKHGEEEIRSEISSEDIENDVKSNRIIFDKSF